MDQWDRTETLEINPRLYQIYIYKEAATLQWRKERLVNKWF